MDSPTQRGHTWRWSRYARIVITCLFIFAVCVPGAFAVAYQEKLDWEGHGSENAYLGDECVSGFWHWILTPGGNNVITEAKLWVTYSDGGTSQTEGYSNNPQNRGAWHFDVTYDDNEVVSAYVNFNYEGDMEDKFILTISNSNCVAEDGDDNGDDDNGDDDNGDDNGNGDNGDDDLPPTGGMPTLGLGLAMAGAGFWLRRKCVH